MTVPDFFPEPEDIDPETEYCLHEGYGVSTDWETKRSGKFYKKVRLPFYNGIDNLLMVLGFDNWHKKYKIERNLIKRLIFGNWKSK